MNEILKFTRLLKKYWYILLLIPMLAAALTYFLVRKLPNEFVSHVRIATGLVDKSDAFLKTDNNDQEFKINQDFSNLIQLMTTRKVVNQVSYQLIINDFSKPPFRRSSKLVNELNASAMQYVVRTCTEKYNSGAELSLWKNEEKGVHRVLVSMGYDYESIIGKLFVYRVGSSDFIDAEFTSENPELSAFVVNTLATEFLSYYGSIVKENQNKAVNFLDSLVRQKGTAMKSKLQELKNFKIKNRILNLQEQARSVYGHIADIETKREVAKKDVEANSAALNAINDKFNPQDRRYFESALINVNQQIIASRDQLKNANNAYIQSGFSPANKKKVDSLQNRLTYQIGQSTDRYIYNPLATKENLVNQKLNLEVNLDLAKNSISSLDAEVARLNRFIYSLVPNEATIQAYESDIDIASREYIELLRKFNQTSLESGFVSKLRLIETGMPGDAKPSKKMLLVALAFIVSLVLCILVLFILYYLDDSIKDAEQLANKTGVPVLGTLNKVHVQQLDENRLWSNKYIPPDQQELKALLRELRFEIDRELPAHSILSITGLSPGQGASFTALQIAYAFAATNKKVLLIDGCFTEPVLSSAHGTGYYLEDFLRDDTYQIPSTAGVKILGNKGGDYSLLELADEETIKLKLQSLTRDFDYIIVDMGSLQNTDKSKEWILFSQKLLSVISVDAVISREKKLNSNYLKNLNEMYLGWVLNKTVAASLQKKKINK